MNLTVDSSDLGGITVGTTDGTFLIELTGEQTSQIGIEGGVYDLLVTPPDQEPIRLVEGKVCINQAVTRRGADR